MKPAPLATHLDEETLELYAMQRVSEPDLARVEEHLLVCQTCQDGLESVERQIRQIRDALLGSVTSSRG